MRLVLVDTGVVSRYAMQKQPFIDAIEYIGFERVVVSAVTKIELFHWVKHYKSALGEKGVRTVLSEINKFPTVQIDRKTSAIAVDLSKHYLTKVPDLLIASTAINNGIELFTVNTKDFADIKGLNLYFPPNFEDIKKTL